jgi:hypothetical protein
MFVGVLDGSSVGSTLGLFDGELVGCCEEKNGIGIH